MTPAWRRIVRRRAGPMRDPLTPPAPVSIMADAMTHPALKYTYEDYLTLPESGPRHELIEGDFIVSPSPKYRHHQILGRLFRTLAALVYDRRLGELIVAPFDVILSDTDVVQPDIVFIATAHRDRIGSRGVRGAPDLVIEVLSEDRRKDLHVKKKLYAQHGVPEYWAFDPDADLVYAHTLKDAPAAPPRVLSASDTLATPLLPGLSIPLADIFAP